MIADLQNEAVLYFDVYNYEISVFTVFLVVKESQIDLSIQRFKICFRLSVPNMFIIKLDEVKFLEFCIYFRISELVLS